MSSLPWRLTGLSSTISSKFHVSSCPRTWSYMFSQERKMSSSLSSSRQIVGKCRNIRTCAWQSHNRLLPLSQLSSSDQSYRQLTSCPEFNRLNKRTICDNKDVGFHSYSTRALLPPNFNAKELWLRNLVHSKRIHTTTHYHGAASDLVSRLPASTQPYLRLARLDRPIGTWLLFWPCGWSICLASSNGHFPDISLLATFAVGAFVMRGAGCTINDMWDKNIDCKVDRTRDRPITSGQVSMFDALVFLGAQLGVGLLILLQLNWYSVLLGAASMGLVVTYPLMKRFTYYPQFVLGLAFNWGALLGWAAASGSCNWSVCLPLYAAGVSWTMIYDTIYAHQDKYDDVIVGVKSTAIKFGDQTDICLACFATTMVACLGYCGWATGQTWPYYLSLLGVGGHLAQQIGTLNIDNPEDCARKFISNRWVGLGVFLGIFFGSLGKKDQSVPYIAAEVLVEDIVEAVIGIEESG